MQEGVIISIHTHARTGRTRLLGDGALARTSPNPALFLPAPLLATTLPSSPPGRRSPPPPAGTFRGPMSGIGREKRKTNGTRIACDSRLAVYFLTRATCNIIYFGPRPTGPSQIGHAAGGGAAAAGCRSACVELPTPSPSPAPDASMVAVAVAVAVAGAGAVGVASLLGWACRTAHEGPCWILAPGYSSAPRCSAAGGPRRCALRCRHSGRLQRACQAGRT